VSEPDFVIDMAAGGQLRFFGGLVNAIASKPACETCRYFVAGYRIPGKGGWGHCHRGHPTLTCHAQGWPHVDVTDWCGEYERAAE
jgi:hypothetical protein